MIKSRYTVLYGISPEFRDALIYGVNAFSFYGVNAFSFYTISYDKI